MLTGEVPFKGENQVAVAMKHVRDDLPDLQARRPEVSAALAAVVERATAKPLEQRYASDEELIADLEDSFAIETARAGQVTGEATNVLRTLPSRARRRLPLRMRHPVRLAIGAFVAGIAAIVLAFVLSQNTHRGTGTAGVEKVAGLQAVSLGQDAVHDFDPFGTPDQHEHANQTGFADDRNPATYWSTESYSGGTLGSKPGVGIYIDAAPEVAARTLEVQTPDPGWTAQVYAAAKGPPSDIGGWTLVGSAHTVVESKQRFDLNTSGRAYRYYLLWITKLKQGATQAKVSEIGLLR